MNGKKKVIKLEDVLSNQTDVLIGVEENLRAIAEQLKAARISSLGEIIAQITLAMRSVKDSVFRLTKANLYLGVEDSIDTNFNLN